MNNILLSELIVRSTLYQVLIYTCVLFLVTKYVVILHFMNTEYRVLSMLTYRYITYITNRNLIPEMVFESFNSMQKIELFVSFNSVNSDKQDTRSGYFSSHNRYALIDTNIIFSQQQGKLIADRDLYQITLNSVSQVSCAERWRLVPLFTITENNICIVDSNYGGRNGDIRDTGAPVYFQNILVAISSVGAPVGNQYFPLATTAVGPYTNWIIANAN